MNHDQQLVSPDNVNDFIRIGTRVSSITQETESSLISTELYKHELA